MTREQEKLPERVWIDVWPNATEWETNPGNGWWMEVGLHDDQIPYIRADIYDILRARIEFYLAHISVSEIETSARVACPGRKPRAKCLAYQRLKETLDAEKEEGETP